MKAITDRPTLLVAVFLAALCALWGAAPALAELGPMTSGIEVLTFDNDQVSLPNTDDSLTLAAEGTVTCSHADGSCAGTVELVLLDPLRIPAKTITFSGPWRSLRPEQSDQSQGDNAG